MTVSPWGSLIGLTGTKSTVPSRRERTLLATIARIIQTAERTSGYSTRAIPCMDDSKAEALLVDEWYRPFCRKHLMLAGIEVMA